MNKRFYSELDDTAGSDETASDVYVSDHRVLPGAAGVGVLLLLGLFVAIASFSAGAWVATARLAGPPASQVVSLGARAPASGWDKRGESLDKQRASTADDGR